MKKIFCLFVVFFICFSFLGAQEIVQDIKPAKQAPVIELSSFIDDVAIKIDKTIIYDNSVQGRKVFISNQKQEKPEELYRLFLSVLEHSGYIVESVGEKGEILKVKRNIQGPWTQTPTLMKIEELNKIQHEDRFVTMVIPLQNLKAKDVQIALRALRIVNPQGGNMVGMEGSNSILITDFAPNVKRVYDVIQIMDQKQNSSGTKVVDEK